MKPGLLGFEAAWGRDYPIVFGSLYIFTLIGLFLRLVSDPTYVLIDPRIDFLTVEVINVFFHHGSQSKNFRANKRVFTPQ